MWYALRDARRRFKQFFSLAATAAALLTVIILAVLWEAALWREDVMPLKEYNYHFSFYNLSEADKEYIRKQPWVLTTYDKYNDSPSVQNTPYENHFCVRVTWENNARSMTLAREVFIQRGIIDREPYAKLYENEYNKVYGKLLDAWMGMTVKNGITIEEMTENNALTFILNENIINTSYTLKAINGYAMQAGFLMRTFLLMLFLTGATLILTLETYRANFREYGALRAIGFKNVHLLFVNLCRSLLVSAVSIPVAAAVTYGAVRLYYLITEPFQAEAADVYFTIADYIPLSTLLVLSLCMAVASLLATLIAFLIYRKKTTMSYLRGENTFTVSFVSKTSLRFENAHSVLEYCRLYAIRARAMLSRYTVVTAIMMPLPMFYLLIGVSALSDVSSAAARIGAIYTGFQSVAVLITTLCVTHAASRMLAASRASELGVIRAIGGSKATVRKVTYPIAAVQFCTVLVLSVILFSAVTDGFATDVTLASKENAKTLAMLASEAILPIASAVLFVLPSSFSGLIAFLGSFFKRPIISSIREVE